MERDKIDTARIQRQKQADGQWRREWDAEKDEWVSDPEFSYEIG